MTTLLDSTTNPWGTSVGGLTSMGHAVPASKWAVVLHTASHNTTLDAASPIAWQRELMKDFVRELSHSAPHGVDSVRSALAWTRGLPNWVSNKPLVSANDDGTFSVEWRTQNAVLHVRFDGVQGEAYFDDGNDEWETDLDAGTDKLVDALRLIG